MLIVLIHNTGEHPMAPAMGRYTYEVRINNRTIARGNIAEHPRSDGWAALLSLVADDGAIKNAMEPRNPILLL